MTYPEFMSFSNEELLRVIDKYENEVFRFAKANQLDKANQSLRVMDAAESHLRHRQLFGGYF